MNRTRTTIAVACVMVCASEQIGAQGVDVVSVNAGATDMHLAGFPNGDGLSIFVEDMDLKVGDRHSNDAVRAEPVLGNRMISDMHRRFGDAVHIHKLR